MSPSRSEPAPRNGRAVFSILLVLAGSAFSGCIGPNYDAENQFAVERAGGGDFLVPTVNRTAKPPSNETDRPEITDPSPDPRLNLTSRWSRGDKWYYESNESRFLRIEVLGVERTKGVRYYVLKQDTGLIGYKPTTTTYSRVTLDYQTVNTTLPNGFTQYEPSHPGLRFLPRQGTYEYNESGYQRVLDRDHAWNRNIRVLVQEAWPLYPVKIPAGRYFAAHFKVFTSMIDEGGKGSTLIVSERWYSPEVRNDIMLKTSTNKERSEWFQLAYFVQDGKKYGIDIDYEK